MRLSDPIPLRLKVEQRERYEEHAANANVPLSTYIRERLEEQDVAMQEITRLRRAVERLADSADGNDQNRGAGMVDSSTLGLLVEMLLTVRTIAGGKSTAAQKEVERMGLNVWRNER